MHIIDIIYIYIANRLILYCADISCHVHHYDGMSLSIIYIYIYVHTHIDRLIIIQLDQGICTSHHQASPQRRRYVGMVWEKETTSMKWWFSRYFWWWILDNGGDSRGKVRNGDFCTIKSEMSHEVSCIYWDVPRIYVRIQLICNIWK